MIYIYSNNPPRPDTDPSVVHNPFPNSDNSFVFRALTEEGYKLIKDNAFLDMLRTPQYPQGARCLLMYSFFDEGGYRRVLSHEVNSRVYDIAGFYPVMVWGSPGQLNWSMRFPYVLLPKYLRHLFADFEKDQSTYNRNEKPLTRNGLQRIINQRLPSELFDLVEPSSIIGNSLTVRNLANIIAQALNILLGSNHIITLNYYVTLHVNSRLANAASRLIAGSSISISFDPQLNVITNSPRGVPINIL